jgi:hypothetical protein
LKQGKDAADTLALLNVDFFQRGQRREIFFVLECRLDRTHQLRRVFGQVEQGAFFYSRALGTGFTVGFSEQDLLVGLVTSGVSDAVDMHDGYRL